ncbi:MAG: hypothetical protein BGO90_00405 [Legionella sp. 40-6]|nr:MAG: hypothetical protein BGO90_00405 [Legionella sp. 40-6]
MSLVIIGAIWLSVANAGSPVWTFMPVEGFPPKIKISPNDTAAIQYKITNNSHRPHQLTMKPIAGLSTAGCTTPLGFQQSCILTLTVNGHALPGDIQGGPVLCNVGSPLQCYQPDPANRLLIERIQVPPPQMTYTVNSSAGINGSISPMGIQTVNSGAALTFTATPDSGYGSFQWLVDGNVVQIGGNTYQLTNIRANHLVTVSFGQTTLSANTAELVLSISGLTEYGINGGQASGLARRMIITNTGSVPATNLSLNFSGLPLDATISSNTCTGTLNGGSSCYIEIQPGTQASSNYNQAPVSTPTPGTITIGADNVPAATPVSVIILGYGCIYQQGYVFALDDTQGCSGGICTGNVGGKVMTTTDQADTTTGIIWSSNGTDGTTSSTNYFNIPGITETDTSPCIGNSDGACNSTQILNHYSPETTYPLAYFAAGLCHQTINGLTDWYLPAACELGYDVQARGTNCGSISAPLLQNILSNLVDPTLVFLNGSYWSSTELSIFAQFSAWYLLFDAVNGNDQEANTKAYMYDVRCVRRLT